MVSEGPRPTEVRLNRYLAMAGVASRRTAAKLIKNGLVTVNGQIIREPGTLVNLEKDVVTYKGKVLRPEKPVYILLNKPKNTLCTVKDPQGRKTVLDLLEGAPPVRLYPVGRLDRNTTGILLLTNDGDLAQKLLHPSTKIPRTYRVTSVKPFTDVVVESLLRGVILPEGIAKADEAYLEDPYTLILTVHIGWKHVVRRMLEKLGYRVKALDRIAFGPIKRKGVPRGKWRFLTPAEVGWLYMAVGQTPTDRLPKRPNPLPPPKPKNKPSETSSATSPSSPRKKLPPSASPKSQLPMEKKASQNKTKLPGSSQPFSRGNSAASSHADSHSRHPRRGSKT
jgi:23S rRNA pseudouridine2605 synthase